MNNFIRITNCIDRLWLRKNKRHFHFIGNNVFIARPLAITGMEYIEIDSDVRIASSVRLAAYPINDKKCRIIIGEGTIIGHFNHIFATGSIEIGQYVITADKVYISDNSHSYEDISVPVLKQPIKQLAPVVIGDGSWLGENVCVLGASIGKHCVIGANSVVTHDIPDYSVAVGAPARVINKYDFKSKQWIKL